MNKICKMEDMPDKSTVYHWMMVHPEFLAAYDIAKEKQMDFYANEILEITDECAKDSDAVAKAKLQVNTRQWLMGKLKPKKYGDRTVIAGDKENPLTVSLASALDHAIASRNAAKTIDHEPADVLELPVIDCETVE